ncbi:MAG: methyltransferase type 11 [Oscillospiraceae bacterium]|nr:methyltransferase type 11 [Oscillospiraceae bacterium]
MQNPWETIALPDYENHMKLESVRQLQALNRMMQAQLAVYPAESVMILGIAGGNGLEHIRPEQKTVYAVDINGAYLRAAAERHPALAGRLRCLQLDLITEAEKLPQAELLLADLLIEYIGYAAFQRAVRQAAPEYVSCVIQINEDTAEWVSDSPYLHAFDGLDAVHHQIAEQPLNEVMREIGYTGVLRDAEPLPNGKSLLRLDFQRR